MTRKSLDCVTSNCRIYVKYSLDSLLVTPFEECTADVKKLFSYFLHNAPNIESIHSEKIPNELHDSIFDRMINDRHFKYQNFCTFNASINKELEKGYLLGDSVCLKCKRFVCKKKKTDKSKLSESNLECFLRHIRNAIAHVRVYYRHAGNKIHIVFEDKNTTGNLSARIVCIKADLEHWKKVLSDPRYY